MEKSLEKGINQGGVSQGNREDSILHFWEFNLRPVLKQDGRQLVSVRREGKQKWMS